ncbi:MAG: hypothetical protein M3680_06380 [Myxococcota bacterium]|nr:hypothetical protein [Myxococcota bacterium]
MILLSAAVLALGCKDKPKQPATAGSGSAAVAPGSGSADSAAGSGVATKKQNELVLPKLAGTPPVKTTKPIDKAKADQLAALEFDGFEKDVRRADDTGLDVRYKTSARPKIAATVNASKCFDCLAMDLAAWKPKVDSLKVLIGPDLKDRADTTFDVGATEVSGATMIWSHHVGYAMEPGEGGAYANAYALHYNDGVNMIRVVSEYKDDVPASRADMMGLTPREDLEAVAKAVMDTFVHQW